MHSDFKVGADTTTYFTKNSISTWLKGTNDRHETVRFFRLISSVNSFEPTVMSMIKSLGVQQSQLINAEEYYLLDITFGPTQTKGV
jgi:hypothetical protein